MSDARLCKEDLDGLTSRGADVQAFDLAEYMGLPPSSWTLSELTGGPTRATGS